MSRTSTTTTALLVPAVLAGSVAALAPAHAAPQPLPSFAFTSDRDGDGEIYLRTRDGRVRKLTDNRVDDYGAVWSPDGRTLAFVSARDGDREIFTMRADGTGVRQLTRNSTTRDGGPVSDQAPAWSPDGRTIAFASTRDGGEPEIYRMNADGTGQVRLTRTAPYVSDHTPTWSPDGRSIAFSSDRVGHDNYEIFRMRADGTGTTRLTRTAAGIDDNAPEYSPDGRRIAFSSTRSRGQHDLYTMAANGTEVRRLGGDPRLDEVFPHWTANGRSVLFETFAAPHVPSADVWTIDSDGTDRRRVVADRSEDGFPDPRPRG